MLVPSMKLEYDVIGPSPHPESIETIFIDDQSFSQSCDLTPPQSPLTSSVSKLDRTHRKTEKERQLAKGRGGRSVGASQIIRQRESWVLYNSLIISAPSPSLLVNHRASVCKIQREKAKKEQRRCML